MIILQIVGNIQFSDPLTAFYDISVPFLLSNIITLLGFLIATWFAIRYTRIFYEGRPLGRSWSSIIYGLISLSMSETLGLFLTYRIQPTIFEGATVLGAQILGVALIALGCYSLSREVS